MDHLYYMIGSFDITFQNWWTLIELNEKCIDQRIKVNKLEVEEKDWIFFK